MSTYGRVVIRMSTYGRVVIRMSTYGRVRNLALAGAQPGALL